MADELTTLTTLAVEAFRHLGTTQPINEYLYHYTDGVLRQLQLASLLPTEQRERIAASSECILSAPEFSPLRPTGQDRPPLVMTVSGGVRMTLDEMVVGLFAAAAIQHFCQRIEGSEAAFVSSVIQNFEELRRAAQGEQVRSHTITGISGVALPEGSHATTPWGVLRPAPQGLDEMHFLLNKPQTHSILVEPRLLSVRFDWSAEPKMDFEQEFIRAPKANLLFPITCAIASTDIANPAGPVETWTTTVLPFQSYFGYSHSSLPSKIHNPPVNFGARIRELEDWARLIDSTHSSTIDVAAARLVSAIGRRLDPVDSLIDAVMVWENLLGTSTETTFRVTASLAKLLESDRVQRQKLQKELAKIYGIRSRIVHGGTLETAKVLDAGKTAISIGIDAMRAFYRRGTPWMEKKSHERADELLLDV